MPPRKWRNSRHIPTVHGVVFDVFVLAPRPRGTAMARFEGNIAKVSAGCTSDNAVRHVW
jgi:hypothetical protein